MKKFLIGLVIGIILGGTGAYSMLKDKAKKVATKENVEVVVKASQDFGNTIKGIFQ